MAQGTAKAIRIDQGLFLKVAMKHTGHLCPLMQLASSISGTVHECNGKPGTLNLLLD